MEKVGEVTTTVLHDLGVDVGDAFARDCDTKAEKTAFLQAFAMAIYNTDVGGMKKVAVPSTVVGARGRTGARLPRRRRCRARR